MKLWLVKLEDELGYYTEEPESLRYELESDLECSSEFCGFTNKDIDEFIETIKTFDTSDSLKIGDWEVVCEEISEYDFENLPEFSGW
jgi:hypothetical protein